LGSRNGIFPSTGGSVLIEEASHLFLLHDDIDAKFISTLGLQNGIFPSTGASSLSKIFKKFVFFEGKTLQPQASILE
jgi:hypothetical protein